MRTLVQLYTPPTADPEAWELAAKTADVAVLHLGGLPPEEDVRLPPALVEAIEALTGAGVLVMGRVDLGYATRALADVLAEVTQWAAVPVTGLFFDRVPAGPFQLGPVALTLRTANRLGLTEAVLNPGVPADDLYRELGALMCTFEGPWDDYRHWTGVGSEPGDGHLLYGVPADDVFEARELALDRGAGLCLTSDVPWASVGTSGTKTKTGS